MRCMVAVMMSREQIAVAVRVALRGVATALGAAGVFFVCQYVTGETPHYLAYATICLLPAAAITMVMEQGLI